MLGCGFGDWVEFVGFGFDDLEQIAHPPPPLFPPDDSGVEVGFTLAVLLLL